MSKFSVPVNGNVITDSQFLLNKIKGLIAGRKLPSNLLHALKEFVQSEELGNILGTKEKEKLQLIFASAQ